MDDWTSVLAALGVPVALALPLSIGLRAAWPVILHAIRVWMVDLGLRRAAGFMHSLRVAGGAAGAPPDAAELDRLLSRGVAYMRQRLGGTLDALKIDAAALRDMVQAEFGELLAKLPAAPASSPALPARGVL